jgi:hypothetical protein
MTKKKILIVLLIVIVAAAGYAAWWRMNQPKSNGFGGRVTAIESDSIKIMGQYDLPENPELINSSSQREVTVKVDSGTKITREMIYLPTSAELELSDGYFDPRQARREVTTGTLQTMSADAKTQTVSVAVKANRDIYKKGQFTATEITYTIAYDPEFFGEAQ